MVFLKQRCMMVALLPDICVDVLTSVSPLASSSFPVISFPNSFFFGRSPSFTLTGKLQKKVLEKSAEDSRVYTCAGPDRKHISPNVIAARLTLSSQRGLVARQRERVGFLLARRTSQAFGRCCSTVWGRLEHLHWAITLFQEQERKQTGLERDKNMSS